MTKSEIQTLRKEIHGLDRVEQRGITPTTTPGKPAAKGPPTGEPKCTGHPAVKDSDQISVHRRERDGPPHTAATSRPTAIANSAPPALTEIHPTKTPSEAI